MDTLSTNSPQKTEEILNKILSNQRNFVDLFSTEFTKFESNVSANLSAVDLKLTKQISSLENQLSTRLSNIDSTLTTRIVNLENNLQRNFESLSLQMNHVETSLHKDVKNLSLRVELMERNIRAIKLPPIQLVHRQRTVHYATETRSVSSVRRSNQGYMG